MWQCGVRVYHHVPPVVLYVSEGVNCTCAYKNMPYDGVQFMYTTMQVCAQVHKAVWARMCACSCTMCELKIVKNKTDVIANVAEWARQEF